MDVSERKSITDVAECTLAHKSSQVFQTYAFGTSAYLTVQSLPLLLTPKLIVSLLASEPRRTTDLETYLCRSLALALLVLAILLLLLTDVVPLTTNANTDAPPEIPGEVRHNAFAKPTLIVTTTYHALTSFYLYTQLTYTWNFAFTAGMLGSSALFCLGAWTILFAGEKGRTSKTTGADKRTSNYPFENKESAREKKKEEREREKEREKSKRRGFGRTKSGA